MANRRDAAVRNRLWPPSRDRSRRCVLHLHQAADSRRGGQRGPRRRGRARLPETSARGENKLAVLSVNLKRLIVLVLVAFPAVAQIAPNAIEAHIRFLADDL